MCTMGPVHYPRPDRFPVPNERTSACLQFATRDLCRQPEDERVADHIRKHPAANVAGRPAEHPAKPHAAVLFGELGEERREVGAKSNRHEKELYLAAKID